MGVSTIMGFIYQFENLKTKKKYIGQTSSKYICTRKGNHKAALLRGGKSPLYNAIRKHGIGNFKFNILLKDIPTDQLDYYEKLWIVKLDTMIPKGYNLTIGGKVLNQRRIFLL